MNPYIDDCLEQIGELAAKETNCQIAAIYLFGSYGQPHFQAEESDVNLLFLLDHDASVHTLREWFLPLWQKHGSWLRRGPWVASLSAFQQSLHLSPDLAVEVVKNGRLLFGAPPDPIPLPSLDPHRTVARQATEALQASTALFPDLLEPRTAQARRLNLRRLARQLSGEPTPEGETAVSTFARVRHILDPQISGLPETRAWLNQTVPGDTASFLPGLQSLYKQTPHLVMVMADLSPDRVRNTRWEQVMDRFSRECEGLVLTTAVQLSLSLVYDNPMGLIFQSYQHNWGLDPIAKLQTSKRQVIRQAANVAATSRLIHLPRAYLTQDDSQLHTIIHDFQNKLLNLRLEYELLKRFGYINQLTLPDPLPDRHASAAERIGAIFRQFDWWAERYIAEMQRAEA